MKTLISTFFLVLISVFAQAQPTGYLWPTDASAYLSSTFGETRSAHFHSGLDIKTWGKEGYNVFASKKGQIVRIAISSQGYGRVLYMQHLDGTFTVYAHLQRFIPELQTYIDSVRLINHVFEIDLDVTSKKWTFEQGDIIGFSGSTGVGPPHLHFEIRNENEQAINALLTNLTIEDTIAPKISAVLVIPMSDTTIIEGSKFPRVYYPSKKSNGILNLGIINARGPIAIAINEFDQADDVSNRYASYEFILESDEGIHFYSKHDSFNFDEAETMFIDRIAAYGATRRSYQTLFKDENFDVPFYKQMINNGILKPTKDSVEYIIRVNDIYDNVTELQFQLLESTFENSVEMKDNPDINQWYWRNKWLTKQSLTSINLQSGNFGENWNSKKNQRLAYFSGERLLVSKLYPDRPHTLFSVDNNLKVHFNASTFFDTTSIAIYLSEKDEFQSFSIMPHSTPLRKKYFVEFYLGKNIEPDQNYQIFHFDPFKDRYTHVPGTLIGSTIHAQPEALGEFVVFPDNEAPSIGSVSLKTTDYGANFLEIDVLDELSGINFKQSEIIVNGLRGITEYDFEEDKLIYIHPNYIPNSRDRIEVLVTDNAGNSRSEVFYL